MSEQEFEGSAFGNAVGRGVDSSQMMIGGFVKAIGDLTGVDALRDWGIEGIIKNMDEIQKNPPRVESWDDIDSLSSFGTYFIEALGEQGPVLATMLATAWGGGGLNVARAGGIGALDRAGKAALGKALKRKLGHKNFAEFEARKKAAIQAGLNEDAARVAGQRAGAAASGYVLNTGETAAQLFERGLDDPYAALGAGAVKTALDVVGIDRIMKAARATRKPPATVAAAAMNVAKEFGGAGTVEALTEGMQSVVDMMVLEAKDPNYDFWTVDNLKSLGDAVLKGGIVGGTAAGGITAARSIKPYMEARAQRMEAARTDPDTGDVEYSDADNLTPDTARKSTADDPNATFEDEVLEGTFIGAEENGIDLDFPMPEAQTTIDAQALAIEDKTSSKRTMIVTPGSPMPTRNPKDAFIFDTPQGTIITTDPEVAANPPTTIAETGRALYNRPEGKTKEDDKILVARDEFGNPVSEFATSNATFDRDLITIQRQTPAKGSYEVVEANGDVSAAQQVLKQRQLALGKARENVEPASTEDMINDMLAQADMDQITARDLEIYDETQQQEADVTTEANPVLAEQNTNDFEQMDSLPDNYGQTEVQPMPTVKRVGYKFNNDNKGFDTEQEAEQAAEGAKAELGVFDAMEFYTTEENGRFFVVQQYAPAEVVPNIVQLDRQSQIARSDLTKGAPYRTEEMLVHDAILVAKKNGAARKRQAESKNIPDNDWGQLLRHRLNNSFINVVTPKGETIQLSTIDLANAGNELVESRQQKSTRNKAQLQLDGFMASLAELQLKGYDVSEAYRASDTKNNRRSRSSGRNDPTSQQDMLNPRVGRLQSSLLIFHGNLQGDTEGVSDVNVKDAIKPTERVNKALNKATQIDNAREAGDKEAPGPAYTAAIRKNAAKEQAPEMSRADGRHDDSGKVQQTSDPRSTQEGGEKVDKRTVRKQREDPIQELDSDGNPIEEEPVFTNTVTDDSGDKLLTEDPVADATDQGRRYEGQPPRATTTKRERAAKARAASKSEEYTAWIARNQKLSTAHGSADQVAGFGVSQDDVDFVAFLANQANLRIGKAGVFEDAQIVVLDVDLIDENIVKDMVGRDMAKKIRAQFERNPGNKAATFAANGKRFIVIRPSSQPNSKNSAEQIKAMRMLVLGHEMGHVLFDAARSNLTGEQMKRLKDMFKKDLAALNIPKDKKHQWKGSNGFEEWFSDKVAAWGKSRSNTDQARPSLAQRIFRDVNKAMRKLWRAMGKRVPARFRTNTSFNRFMDEVSQPRRDASGNQTFYFDPALATINSSVKNMLFNPTTISDNVTGRTAAQAFAALVKTGVNELSGTRAGRAIMTVDAQLRYISAPLANALYTNVGDIVEHGDTVSFEDGVTKLPGGKSYHTGVADTRRFWESRAHEVHSQYDQKTLTEAYYELATDTPTNELQTEAAKGLRKLMDDYWNDYIVRYMPHMKDKKVENYFPHSYDEIGIAARSEEFIAILEKHGIKNAEGVAQSLTREQNLFDGADDVAAITEGWMKERKLNDRDLVRELVDAGFLNNDPVMAFGSYMRKTTRRVEKERLFGGWNDEKPGQWDSHKHLTRLLTEIPELEQRIRARELIQASIQPHHLDPNDKWHNFLAEVKAYESWRVLMGSGLASIAETAGIFARTKGQIGVAEYAKMMGETITDWHTAKGFAEDLGVLHNASTAAMLQEVANDPTLGRTGIFAKHLPKLFKWNGNELVTNYTRVIAIQAAKLFLQRSAVETRSTDAGVAKRATRYLRELNISPETINKWNALGKPISTLDQSPENIEIIREVRAAISRFTDDAVLHPNAAERPAWAQSPLGGFVFHLKQFAYTYNKRVLGGILREANARLENGESLKEYTPHVAATFFVFMVMGAATDELRQRVFSLGTQGSWDKSYWDKSRMVSNWADRAGFFSLPFYDIYRDPTSLDNWAYGMGPTAHHFYSMFLDMGPKEDALKAMMAVPFLNQMPAIKREIAAELG